MSVVPASRYSARLMDHFMNPRHAGSLDEPSGFAEVKNETCGDVTRIYVLLENGRIRDARFLARGCGPGIACASYLLERVTGASVESALEVSVESVARALSLPAPKRHAAELAVAALRQALDTAVKGDGC